MIEASANTINVQWNWDRATWSRAQLAMARHRRHSVRSEVLSSGVVAVTATAVGILMRLGPGYTVLVVVLAVLGGKVGSWVVTRLTVAYQAWQFKRHCLPKYGSLALSANDRALTIESGDSKAELRWSAFVRAVETDEFLLLYAGSRSGYYIPRKLLSDAQAAFFREQVKRTVLS